MVLPLGPVELGHAPLWEDANEVAGNAPASDVGNTLQYIRRQEGQNDRQVAAVWTQQLVCNRYLPGQLTVDTETERLEDHLPRQRVAIRPEAIGGESDDDVAGRDVLAGDERLLASPADHGADEVILLRHVGPWHLGRLPGDDGNAQLQTGMAHAGERADEGVLHIGQVHGGEVVDHAGCPAAVAGHVIGHVDDEISAYAFVAPSPSRHLELSADAVVADKEHIPR